MFSAMLNNLETLIVDISSNPHVGSFRVDGTASKPSNYTQICFILIALLES